MESGLPWAPLIPATSASVHHAACLYLLVILSIQTKIITKKNMIRYNITKWGDDNVF
ncbi:MAG: hypothetical protein ACRCYW_01770 [Aeromonas sp.]|uniref:hypothetical protein n=1 Tax=Aeromonas sp. TaxID=647 RepID=UPI003F3A5CBD